MRQFFLPAITVVFILSCNHPGKFPPLISEKIPLWELEITDGVDVSALEAPENFVKVSHDRLDSLTSLMDDYFNNDENFSLISYRLLWNSMRNELNPGYLVSEDAYQWFKLTGFLFQLTGDEEVVSEMERLVYTSLATDTVVSNTLVAPYIFTRDGDYLYLNLYFPASVSYQHSLGGGVKITQQSAFPETGRISLHFSMETKRYIELYVRIPWWAHQASVTVKGVKYLTHPGQYSRIAKQWKEGDVVEIELPLNNLPKYIRYQQNTGL